MTFLPTYLSTYLYHLRFIVPLLSLEKHAWKEGLVHGPDFPRFWLSTQAFVSLYKMPLARYLPTTNPTPGLDRRSLLAYDNVIT